MAHVRLINMKITIQYVVTQYSLRNMKGNLVLVYDHVTQMCTIMLLKYVQLC